MHFPTENLLPHGSSILSSGSVVADWDQRGCLPGFAEPQLKCGSATSSLCADCQSFAPPEALLPHLNVEAT